MEKIKKPVRTRNRVELISIGNFTYYFQKVGALIGPTILGGAISLALFVAANEVLPSFLVLYICSIFFNATVASLFYMFHIPNAKKIEVLPDTLSLRISEYWNNDDAIIVPLIHVLSVGKTGMHAYKLQLYSEKEKGWVRFHSTDRGIEFMLPFFTGDVLNSDVKYLQNMVKYAKNEAKA